MKKAIFLISLFFLSSCEQYPFLPDKYSETILGNWQWGWTGCWGGGYYLWADTAGYTRNIIFDHQGRYYSYQNDSLTMSSKYHLDYSESHHDYRIYKLTIETTNEEFRALIIADTLSLMEYNIRDGCEIFYIKQ